MRKTLITIAFAAALISSPPARAAQVVGRILNVGGEPAAHERVQLRELKSGKLVGDIYSDATGNYRIDNVKPGAYILYVRQQTGVAYVNKSGLTVDWGLAPNAPPVAVATRGVTANLRGKSTAAVESAGTDDSTAAPH
jgi:Carboxypeptidase regulatory-like domain